MKRIFPDFTYGPGPRQGCWWDETVPAPDWSKLQGDRRVDVAIVGGGFTGISAALYLSKAGASVAVLEAEAPGWGASGRNGGFCCLGGSKLSRAAMVRRYGAVAAADYALAERDAVGLVADLLKREGIDADAHSRGETQLAHSPRAMSALRRSADPGGVLHEPEELVGLGLGGGFHGGYTNPVGFGLNPRKYLFGLASATRDAGAQLFQNSAVLSLTKQGGRFEMKTREGQIRSDKVLICTNGYSSEDLPGWLAGRYMPVQSTVMVTRPLRDAELQAQGWTSDQICYDTRNLLHYFRLMPDRRFLFGMRGGLRSTPRSELAIRRRLRRDFDRMFPAWSAVEASHVWSGMVCLSRSLVPFAGQVPERPGLFAALAYHGNGVAMGTYCGRALGWLALGRAANIPAPIAEAPRRFPFGSWRRILMPPAYAALALSDL